jgi:hypothetical protein
MRPLVTVVLAALMLAPLADAGSYRWRLKKPQVLAIAERAMRAKHFDAAKFPERIVKQREKDHEWSVVFSPPMPAPVDSDVLVIVSDETGEAKVYYGV